MLAQTWGEHAEVRKQRWGGHCQSWWVEDMLHACKSKIHTLSPSAGHVTSGCLASSSSRAELSESLEFHGKGRKTLPPYRNSSSNSWTPGLRRAAWFPCKKGVPSQWFRQMVMDSQTVQFERSYVIICAIEMGWSHASRSCVYCRRLAKNGTADKNQPKVTVMDALGTLPNWFQGKIILQRAVYKISIA